MHATAFRNIGIVIAKHAAMALFWETPRVPAPAATAAPLSPLAIALLLKLQADASVLRATP